MFFVFFKISFEVFQKCFTDFLTFGRVDASVTSFKGVLCSIYACALELRLGSSTGAIDLHDVTRTVLGCSPLEQ